MFVLMPAITMFTSERIAAEHGVTIKHYHAAPMDSSIQRYSQSKWSSASEAFPPMGAKNNTGVRSVMMMNDEKLVWYALSHLRTYGQDALRM